MLRAHRMKSDEKTFLCQIYAIFFKEKHAHVVIHRYVSLYLKDYEDFSKPL